MTPAEQQAIARLTHAAETVGERVVDVARADLRAVLSLLRPVASVEGYHCRYDEVPCKRCEARIIAENEARHG